MSQGRFAYKSDEKDHHFKDINEIIPNERENKFFDVEEVDLYKIIFE